MDHCPNFDQSYKGCEQCEGKVTVVQPDGRIDIICRAGESFIRRLIASSEHPIEDVSGFPTIAPSEPNDAA